MSKQISADFLIFDLGNVIIDIDYQRSLNHIKSLVSNTLHDRVDYFYLTDFHKEYEKGKMDSPAFRRNVNEYFGQNWSDSEVDLLWNSLLGNIPPSRIELIQKLKNKYQIGILSNTNAIHIDAVNEMLQKDFGVDSFHQLVDHVFYSHEMGLAKPQQEIYQTMLEQLSTKGDKVIFFDDLEANVLGAKSCGITAIQVTGPEVIFDYFKHV
ncbi:HAD family hydrolase [Algoriphagus mannitolivorans]|uniref:HAD family hydrolase n=1 Tax=Algoriphagus mannitolivorans TaxID=226504 RepID=UPI00041FC335|nr:HAD family phosphatase [Algoriphagus mannitolivorans]